MIKHFIYIALLVAVLAGCNNSQSASTNRIQKDSIIKTSVDSLTTEIFTEELSETEIENDESEEEIKELKELLKTNKEALVLVKKIKKATENEKQIKNIEDLEEILGIRDSLISLLNDDEEFQNMMEGIDGVWNYSEKFEKIGITIITAEGIYLYLEKAPLIEGLIEKYADEPFKLKTKIENLCGEMPGGEYPHTDLEKELEIIPLAEQMLVEHPGYKYNKEIAKILDRALMPLVDFHTVGCEDSFGYIVGNYRINDFPGVTDISFHKQFIAENKNSRFAKIIGRILNSPSNMCTWGDTLYYISVPDLKQEEKVFADEKLNEQLKNLPEEFDDMNDSFKYLWLGIDVPHYLIFADNEKYSHAIAYRFYGEKEPALKSLQTIRKVIPKAKLIEHLFSEDEKKYELGEYN